jgi:hypothetical protein
MAHRKWIFLFCYLVSRPAISKTEFNLGINIQAVFGTHNQYIRAGVVVFGSSQEQNLALESGAGLWIQRGVRRFNAKTLHWSSGYDAFGVVGLGDNSNQLGSALTELAVPIFFNNTSDKGFVGIGFGVNKEYFSGSLSKFSQRRGRAIIRLANKQSSLHISFANDLRDGLFNGEASDFAQTASATAKYTQIRNDSLTQYGLSLDLFTPQPDFNRLPDNEKNSSDGRRRVWYTTKPWENLYNANLYIEYARQDQSKFWSAKIGIDSPKLGAFAQNSIHDELGLTPRFPWPIEKADRVFFESTIGYQYDE